MKLLLSAAILAASCAQEDCPFCPDGLEVVSFSFMSGREAVVLRPTYIRPLARSMIHLDNTHSTAIISCVLSPVL